MDTTELLEKMAEIYGINLEEDNNEPDYSHTDCAHQEADFLIIEFLQSLDDKAKRAAEIFSQAIKWYS